MNEERGSAELVPLNSSEYEGFSKNEVKRWVSTLEEAAAIVSDPKKSVAVHKWLITHAAAYEVMSKFYAKSSNE